MNSAFHKAQAEGLIKEYNSYRDDTRHKYTNILVLAQVHATLATVKEYEE